MKYELHGVLTNRRYLESLSDYDFAELLMELGLGKTVDYDRYENPIETFYDIWITSDGKTLPTTMRLSNTKSGGCGNARR